MTYTPPAAYGWLPATLPEPDPWVTVPAVTVPSPQSIVAEWVSSVPTSVKAADTETGCPSTVEPIVGAELLMAVTTGATFFTVTAAEAEADAPWLSVTVSASVTVKNVAP